MENIFGIRLKSARLMQNLSLEQLAVRMNHIVKKQSLSKYEKGEMLPTSSVLLAVAEALSISVDYFFSERKINLDNLNFRKKASLSQKELFSIQEKATDQVSKYLDVENICNIAFKCENPLADLIIENIKDVEKATLKLRESWNLGLSPIHNVVEMLEKYNCKIIELEVNEDFDGLSAMVNGEIPVIVVNAKFNNVRKRFTVLHELAHLFLKLPDSLSEKEKENYCHYFAGAFLIPEEVLKKEIGEHRTNIYPKEFLMLKEDYGVSIQALIRRVKDLDVISDSYYKSLMIEISIKGFKKNEPGVHVVNEKSDRFEQLVYKSLAESYISASKAASLLGENIQNLNAI